MSTNENITMEELKRLSNPRQNLARLEREGKLSKPAATTMKQVRKDIQDAGDRYGPHSDEVQAAFFKLGVTLGNILEDEKKEEKNGYDVVRVDEVEEEMTPKESKIDGDWELL